MKNIKANNKCRGIRGRLYEIISSRFGFDADWVQSHVSNCPRCQRRLVSAGRVNLVLSAMRTEPHNLDLLMRANTQAIGVLKHSLRKAPKAQKLKTARPEPKLFERLAKYSHSTASAAGCIAVLFFMKVGVFSSMHTFQKEGEKVVKQYYVSRAGQELADEVFGA